MSGEAEDLKPCPFCGSNKIATGSGSAYHAYCLHCRARGPIRWDRKDAIPAWNRRAGEPDPDTALAQAAAEAQAADDAGSLI